MPGGLPAAASRHGLIPVREDPETGCWIWLGPIDGKGYGRISISGRWVQAHVYAWSVENGPLRSKLDLDHLCRRRLCCRPQHLEPVTRAENIKRTHARYRRALERCPEQHRLDEFGIPTPEGGVVCRVCSFPTETT